MIKYLAMSCVVLADDDLLAKTKQACSNALGVKGGFTRDRLKMSIEDESKCRQGLKGLGIPGAVGHGNYPTTIELVDKKVRAEAIGQAACAENADSETCQDYQRYWRQTNVTIHGDIASIASKELQRRANLSLEFGKLLIVAPGLTFRYSESDGHMVHETCLNESIAPQRNASLSLSAFIRFIKQTFGIESQLIISTREFEDKQCDRPELLEQLKQWYPIGTEVLVSDAECMSCSSWKIDRRVQMAVWRAIGAAGGFENFKSAYGGILVVRPDLYLKPQFFADFDLFDKITFPFVADPMSSQAYKPLICDAMAYVPRMLFETFADKNMLINEAHGYSAYPSDKIGFMINTFHITNSKEDFNPLYFMVDRPQESRHLYSNLTTDDFIGVWTHKHRTWEPTEDERIEHDRQYAAWRKAVGLLTFLPSSATLQP